MDFRFTGDEQEIIGEAGRVLRKVLPASRHVAGKSAADAWRVLGEAGWLHAGLPEDLGGGDLPLILVAAIGREAGGVLAGDGFVDNAVLLPRLAALAGDTNAIEGLLEHPGFVSRVETGRDEVRAYGVENGLASYRLSGETLQRVDPDDWAFTPEGGFGVTTGSVTYRDGYAVGLSVPIAGHLTEIERDASIVHAATLVGAGFAAMDDTIEHVGARVQFGGPIGRFQAVKHMLAEVRTELEVAWNAVAYAALKPSPDSASIACLQASRAADHAARAMIQLFGGIAMTWEHHAHWYVKVIETSRHRFGTTQQHALILADRFEMESAS